MGAGEKKEDWPKGRGASSNPGNRFELLEIDWDEELDSMERPAPQTSFLEDASESIITYNNSPDIPFKASINPYRGCEHGCAYCYARPTHEYLGFSAGLDFESRIMIKTQAPNLLRSEFSSSRWNPQMLAMSGVTDPYQPIERKLELTRKCLEVCLEFRNPVGIVTKNRLVTRDIDILSELAKRRLCVVLVSINSLDGELARNMEPRTSSPRDRLNTVRQLAEAGVPVGSLVAPVVPGLNDHEIPSILKSLYEAGAQFANYVLLRLPLGVKDLFFAWVQSAYPTKLGKIEDRIRGMRDGELNSSKFGKRMTGEGIFADQIRQMYQINARRYGLDKSSPPLDTTQFRRPGGVQLDLF